MNIFNSKKHDKLLDLLSKARVNFNYNKNGVRNRLMVSIEESQLSSAEQRVRALTHKSFMRRHKLATMLSLFLLVVVGSGAALAQADITNPGDRFHSIDQLGERLLLKLPLSKPQKAEMQANFVDERNKELDYLVEYQSPVPIKLEAVKESQTSLNEAIKKTWDMKENYEQEGKVKESEKIELVLTRLQALAEEQEKKVEGMWADEKNDEMKKLLEEQIEQIKKAKQRMRSSQ